MGLILLWYVKMRCYQKINLVIEIKMILQVRLNIKIRLHLKLRQKIRNLLDKINNKISAINKLNEGLAKVKADVTKKIELIYESIYELQDDIYRDNTWLILVQLDKIDAIIDGALNVIWKVLYGNKNRIIPKMIMIDKNKDIDGYVSKLTDVMNNKIG